MALPVHSVATSSAIFKPIFANQSLSSRGSLGGLCIGVDVAEPEAAFEHVRMRRVVSSSRQLSSISASSCIQHSSLLRYLAHVFASQVRSSNTKSRFKNYIPQDSFISGLGPLPDIHWVFKSPNDGFRLIECKIYTAGTLIVIPAPQDPAVFIS
ncbi:hypothetical protein SISNIDRAFT_491858 [Sistotremastrum niveocremeum HHB9708]|uniref:Uncharacterized protein n=1 Tax=Sistotremastrum niveocremeum HHB9708 TaxID=1314777 RepID=A0A164MB69_9AGAM|nr:hypothetical protein SISNIDRAFT_491858 [Sistotremastrum niveocremeum HHB9708]